MTQGPLRYRFRTSIPSGNVSPERWKAERARWHKPDKPEPLELIFDPVWEPCRHEKCWITGVHPAHEQDFVGGRPPKSKPDYKARGKKIAESRRRNTKKGYKEPYKIVRMEPGPNGPIAIAECEVCAGAGCDECYWQGVLPLFMWWQRRNQRR